MEQVGDFPPSLRSHWCEVDRIIGHVHRPIPSLEEAQPQDLPLGEFADRPSPRATSDVHDTHHARVVIDGEEHAVSRRLASVGQRPNRVIRVNALSRDWATLRVLVEREDGLSRRLNQAAPCCGPVRRPTGATVLTRPSRSSRSHAVCHAYTAIIEYLPCRLRAGGFTSAARADPSMASTRSSSAW